METTIKIGTTAAILAPFFPHGVEVDVHNGDVRRGRVTGLLLEARGLEVELPEPLAVSGFTKTMVDIATCLPVLRPFEALCTPLEDGTVPAVKVMEMILAGSCSRPEITFAPAQINGGWVIDSSNGYFIRVDQGWNILAGLDETARGRGQVHVDPRNCSLSTWTT